MNPSLAALIAEFIASGLSTADLLNTLAKDHTILQSPTSSELDRTLAAIDAIWGFSDGTASIGAFLTDFGTTMAAFNQGGGLPAQLVGPLGIITKGAATVDVALSFFQAGNAWIAYQENPSDNALYNAYLTAALKAIVQVSLAAALSAAGLEIGVIATAIVLAGQIVDLQNFHNILVALGVGYNPIASAFNWPALPTLRDPLVVNFEGDPLGFTSASNSPVYFDFTGSGSATETGWITSGEGLLLLNNGSSNISSEVLGAQSGSGFADLATLDTNGDGIISDQDASFGSLEVWFDQNGNGQIDPGEVKSLSDLGITGISLATNPVGGTVNGNIVVSRSQFSTATNGSSAGTVTEV